MNAYLFNRPVFDKLYNCENVAANFTFIREPQPFLGTIFMSTFIFFEVSFPCLIKISKHVKQFCLHRTLDISGNRPLPGFPEFFPRIPGLLRHCPARFGPGFLSRISFPDFYFPGSPPSRKGLPKAVLA